MSVFVNYKKDALDSQPQVIKFTSQLLAHGRWFSPGTPPSSTTKTGRHEIAESGGMAQPGQRLLTLTEKVLRVV